MTRGVGVNLGAIERDGAKLEQLHLPGNTQHLHEQRCQLLQKAPAEGAQRVMVGLLVASDIAKSNRVMRRHLDAPARINARRVAVNEQAQHYRRVVGSRASAAVLPAQRRADRADRRCRPRSAPGGPWAANPPPTVAAKMASRDLSDGSWPYQHSRYHQKGHLYDKSINLSFRSLRQFQLGKSDRLLGSQSVHATACPKLEPSHFLPRCWARVA